ncbi:uncharacterized protein A1O9_08613 [Exophiala aquamarina CBS 119918]|uniref:DUF6603 domain-containing protein n=1 Tax=Exophiala aquamarina CBS 119918 TaxID=1182545 RepID=A0A072P520_9EURO|nr:uncharacterized protein A1O9_08613 [Exophiala aquamarina CBS 119918]KEF54961.1 hypothetical protein A1O9_08613 [Exophiala aquamarina CBS 119918]
MADNDVDLSEWTDFFENSQLFAPTGLPTEGDNNSTCVLNKLGGLAFSSEKVQQEFRGNAPSGDEPFELLGLDQAVSSSHALQDILNTFGVNPDTWSISPILPDQDETEAPVDIMEPLRLMIQELRDAAGVSAEIEHENRNGLWIIPKQETALAITVGLAFKINLNQVVDIGNNIVDKLNELFGLKLSELNFSGLGKLKIRIKSRTVISKTEGDNGQTVWEDPSTLYEFLFQFPVFGLLLNFRITYVGEFEFSVSEDPSDTRSMFEKIASLIKQPPSADDADPTTDDQGFSITPRLWNLTVTKTDSAFEWSIAFLVKLKISAEWDTLTMALTYNGAIGTFTGRLIFKGTFNEPSLDVEFDEIWDVPTDFYPDLTDRFDFRSIPQFESLPNSFPTNLTEASFEYTKGSPYKLLMSATLNSDGALEDPPAGADEVPFPFEWTTISLYFAKSGSTLEMEMFTQFQLNPPDDRFGTGRIDLRFRYASGLWELGGHADNIQVGSIAPWFDPNLQSEVLDVVGKLKIVSVDLAYSFEKSGPKQKASAFTFEGLIEMGELQLSLLYQYQKITEGAPSARKLLTGSEKKLGPVVRAAANESTFWLFEAILDTPQPETTLAEIAESIVEGAAAELPSFVGDIQVKSDDAGAELMSLRVQKSGYGGVQRVVFVFNVNIATLEFTFAQVSSKIGTSNATKRLLRVAVEKIPLLSDLPVVKELPQPFDELQYMWSQTAGLVRTEVEALNQNLGEGNELMFKATTKSSVDPTSNKDPVVFAEGHHFVVVNDGQAILDHVFKPTKNQGSTTVARTLRAGDSTPAASLAASDEESKPSKGALSKTTQFLSISGVTFQYKGDRLWITLDATVVLGPLEFSLLGFGVGLNLSAVSLNQLDIVKLDPQVQLRGMAASFDKPPILIAGIFEMDEREVNGQHIKSYRGGVGLTIPPYAFVAVGEYAEVEEGSEKYKSVFIYAKLDGPLIDFQFAILRGVRIGFGYNSLIRSPSVRELHRFPLISDNGTSGTGNNPMEILENMRGGDNPWIQLKNNSYWLAFGLTISSFNIVNCTAVALVSFRANGVIFSIFGDVICTLPPSLNANAAFRLFYVEILMNAELNFVEDCFKVQAALAPSSFLLVPMARLRGGFALYTFFGRSPHAGDWVFSLGGYHRKFSVPSHYPRPERLGLDFSIGIISIEGKGYFALTPKAVMAGAFIHCELHVGPVFAYLDAAFDAMVQFEPVHYWVDMHVEVGVECRVRLLFVTIHISISIGAELHIEGPEFGGIAHVDFWFFSFDIEFGKRPSLPAPLTLAQFYDVCAKAGPPDAANGRTEPPEGLVLELKFSLEDGNFVMPTEDTQKDANGNPVPVTEPTSTGAGAKWFVKGGSFKFRVSSVFALSAARIETPESGEDEWIDDVGYAHDLPTQEGSGDMEAVEGLDEIELLSARPMGVSRAIKAPLYVGIRDADTPERVTTGWTASFVIQQMPKQMWLDPGQSIDALSREKGSMPLRMGVQFEAPPPVLAVSKIPPFNATDMSKFNVAHKDLPDHEAEQDVFLPAPRDAAGVPATWPAMQEAWAATAALWDRPSEEGEPVEEAGLARAMLTACMSALAWDKPSPETLAHVNTDEYTPWELPDVKFPERLVKGTTVGGGEVRDGFANYYLELPRVVAV